ncbi:MAG: hypothetical protein K8F27_09240 [Sulfuricellaceae bacterium]|nr:hypothetical protein [Sulfuricellaceae bacterium]
MLTLFRYACFALALSGTAAAAAPLSLSAGGMTVAVVQPDGGLWMWGDNTFGEIGDGKTLTSNPTPKQVASGYAKVVVGDGHVLGLKSDGSLWVWGSNNRSQLGNGLTANLSVPNKLGDGYKDVAAGVFMSAALKSDGTLWGWGWYAGDGTSNASTTPVQIGTGYSALGPSGGYFFFAFKADGSLWAWGANSSGQVDGSVCGKYGCPSLVSAPRQIGSGYVAVAGGLEHTLALKSDGSLWTWGQNIQGQLGDGSTAIRYTQRQIGSGYKAIAAGDYHSLAIKNDGSLWAWGRNTNGQLGDGSTTNRSAPVQIGTGYASVEAGSNYSVAVKDDGSLWAWGNNGDGRLGNGGYDESHVPTPVVMSAAPATGAAAPTAGTPGSVGLKLADNWGVTAQITPASEDVGQPSNIWVGALVNGVLFMRGGSTQSWSPYTGGALPVAQRSAALPAALEVTVADYDLSAFPGLDIYVGYGNSEGDLGKSGHLAKIYTVPGSAPVTPVSVPATPESTASSYAGSYAGSYSGDDAGTVDFSVDSGGKISVSSPASGSGSISNSGAASLATGGGSASTISCSFTGSFSSSGSASGSWTCTDSSDGSTTRGAWSAYRQ